MLGSAGEVFNNDTAAQQRMRSFGSRTRFTTASNLGEAPRQFWQSGGLRWRGIAAVCFLDQHGRREYRENAQGECSEVVRGYQDGSGDSVGYEPTCYLPLGSIEAGDMAARLTMPPPWSLACAISIVDRRLLSGLAS